MRSADGEPAAAEALGPVRRVAPGEYPKPDADLPIVRRRQLRGGQVVLAYRREGLIDDRRIEVGRAVRLQLAPQNLNHESAEDSLTDTKFVQRIVCAAGGDKADNGRFDRGGVGKRAARRRKRQQ